MDSERNRRPRPVISTAGNRKSPGLSRLAVVYLALLLLGACTYSFKGSLPPHLKTVSIPLMENSTPEYGIAEELTDLLIERFLREGLLRVADDETADSRLVTTLRAIDETPFDYDEEEQVRLIKVSIKIFAEFEDLVEGRVLWKGNFSEWGSYNPEEGGREDAVAEAVEKLVLALGQKLLSDW